MITFYSVRLFNHDEFEIGNEKDKIGEFYFRLDHEEWLHRRVVYGLLDLLSDIGGLKRGTMESLKTLGFFVAFLSNIELMLHLYSK